MKFIKASPSIVNECSEDGWTPLHLATYFGQKEIASFLLESGADIHSRAKTKMKIRLCKRELRTSKVNLLLS